jgi:hypothetical protein
VTDDISLMPFPLFQSSDSIKTYKYSDHLWGAVHLEHCQKKHFSKRKIIVNHCKSLYLNPSAVFSVEIGCESQKPINVFSEGVLLVWVMALKIALHRRILKRQIDQEAGSGRKM